MQDSLENEVLESTSQLETIADEVPKKSMLNRMKENIAEYVSGCWSKARKYVLGGVLGTGITLGAMGAAYGLPIEITEDNGLPDINGIELSWNINIYNDNIWDANMTQAILYDVFSAQTPTFGTLQTGWAGSSIAGSGPNLWNIILSASLPPAYVGDGSGGDYIVRTYLSDLTKEVVAGTLYGQGAIEGAGWYPSLPGDSWQGPTGEMEQPGPVPEPATYLLLGSGLVAIRLFGRKFGIGTNNDYDK
jgi:hypothetical protein